MWKKIAALMLLLMLPFAAVAWGDNEPLRIASLEIQAMPEFMSLENWPKDQPSLLTGIYGSIVNGGTEAYSGPITIQLPKSPDTSVHVVAEFKDQESSETQLKYEYNADKGSVVWTPNQPIAPNTPYYFVVEYYSNPFTIQNKDHKFEYSFTPTYPVDDAKLYIYKPSDSIDFQLSQAEEKKFANEMGQDIYQLALGALKSGEEKRVEVHYLKDNLETVMEKHSKTAQQQQSSQNAGGAAGGSAGASAANAGQGQAAAAPAASEVDPDAPKADASKDSWIIGGSIVIFGLLVFMGLRSYRAPVQQAAALSNAAASAVQKQQQIRALRARLLNEELTEEQYLLERKSLV